MHACEGQSLMPPQALRGAGSPVSRARVQLQLNTFLFPMEKPSCWGLLPSAFPRRTLNTFEAEPRGPWSGAHRLCSSSSEDAVVYPRLTLQMGPAR